MSSNYENCSFVHYAIFGSGELKVESKGKPCQITFHFLRIYFLIIEVWKVHIIGASMRKIVIDKKHSPKFNVRLAGCVNYLSVELKAAFREHERACILGIHGLKSYVIRTQTKLHCFINFLFILIRFYFQNLYMSVSYIYVSIHQIDHIFS